MKYAAHIKWLDEVVDYDASMAQKTGDNQDEDKLDDLDVALLKRERLEDPVLKKKLASFRDTGAAMFDGMIFVSSKGKDREMIASDGKGDRITRMGKIKIAADEELNVGDDRTGLVDMVKIKGADGKLKELDPKSDQYRKMTEEIAGMTRELLALSKEMEDQGFSPAEIEREIWTPLVRQKAFPADQVPDKYSQYVQVMSNASALYEEVLEKADGSVGEERFGDKLLGGIRDTVDVAKVFGSEFMRYEFNPIIESTRVDLSKWIEWNKENKAEWAAKFPDAKSLKDMVKMARSANNDALTDDLSDEEKAELNKDPYDLDGELEGLSGEERDKKEAEILAKWSDDKTDSLLEKHSATLEAKPYEMTDDMSDEEKSEILAQWAKDNPEHEDAALAANVSEFNIEHHNVEMGERTDMFGDKVEAQAYYAGACAAVETSLSIAEQSRKKKKERSVVDMIETGAQGVMGIVGAALTIEDDNLEAAIDEDTQTQAFQEKYGVAAGKAAITTIASVVRIAQAGGDPAKLEKAIGEALSSFMTATGSTIAALHGKKEETEAAVQADEATGTEYQAAEYDDSRKEAANIALIMSSTGTVGIAVKNLVKLARNKDWEAFALQMSSLAVSGAGAGVIEAGGKLRVQVEEGEITEENYGAVGGIYKESEHQGAQGTYGFSGDLVTAADQKEMESMQAELNDALVDFNSDATGAKVQAAFDKLRNKVNSLPGAREAAAEMMEEEREELRQKMAEADPDAIMALSGGDANKAAQRAMNRIEELTIQLKKDEARLNMLTGGAKFMLAAVAQAAPGVSIGVKVFDLLNDIRVLVMRVQQLMIWRDNLVASFGNYSIYSSAAAGEHDLKSVQTTMDSIKVAADILGVTAESLRVADATHIGASVATTLEKSMKVLSAKWYKHWSKKKIADGWETFKLARDYPENRRLAREAIRMNSTLAKCVMAYGACVERDPIATRMMSSCGLTPEVLEDDNDVCHAVVAYLEAKLGTDTAVKGAHGGGDWFPREPALNFETWTMFKATAMTLDPPLEKSWFSSNMVEAPMKAVCDNLEEINGLLALKRVSDPNLASLKESRKEVEGLTIALLSAKPTGDAGRGAVEHNEMKLALHAFAIETKGLTRDLDAKIDKISKSRDAKRKAKAAPTNDDSDDDKKDDDD